MYFSLFTIIHLFIQLDKRERPKLMIPWLVWTTVAIIVSIAALIFIGGNPQSTYLDDTFFGLVIVGT
jgi:hypothetical protein